MSKQPDELPDLSWYIHLIEEFIADRMSAPDFQKAYLSALKLENRGLEVPIFDVLQRLFGDADAYVAYPELRTEPEDLDDEQLRECAIRARSELRELGYN
ncbi:colicin immunity domain-containing protein [Mycolicibacterium stellerae]|uniref:colicin immunity domain-containing protein n=1 Tax=Mycolicibacterium stellerae TaxID=2358193 RepID=UPI000F0BC898|nr:colicin immunity domain-containing protein [Mycolicibacterium stellerae]